MAGISETRTYDSLLTTTLAEYHKTLYDNVFDVYPLLSWLNGSLGTAVRRNPIKRIVDSGESIVVPILYETNSTAQRYAGAETLDTTLQEGMSIARYAWKQYAVTVGITGLERRNNSGRAQIVSLLQGKIKQAEMSLRNLMNPDAFGTGANSKAFSGLQEIVDDTSARATGGIAWNGLGNTWKNIVETSIGSFATNGRSKMRSNFNNASYGNDTPDAIFTDQNNFERYEATFDDKERVAPGGDLNAGFQMLGYRGIPLVWDRDCPAGYMYMLNSNYMEFAVHRDADMKMGEFVTPVGQDVTTAKIIFQGNLTCSNRRMHVVMTGFTD